MEEIITGTADLQEINDEEAITMSTRKAENRRRKEEKALRREMKRQERLSRATANEEVEEEIEEQEERVEKPCANKVLTPLSLIDPILIPSTQLQPEAPRAPPQRSRSPELKAIDRRSNRFTALSRPVAILSEPRRKPTKPKTPRASGSSSSTRLSQTKAPKPTDEELWARFTIPGAAEEYLTSQIHSATELKRLANAGILTYKTGRFTDTEDAAIRRHLDLFAHINRLDEDELVGTIMAKSLRKERRKEFPDFWLELGKATATLGMFGTDARTIAKVVPGRPVKYVRDHTKRMYDPRGHKGCWTAEEDAKLLQAHSVLPSQWAKIADIVDRTEQDVRDRYKNELQHKDTVKIGRWTSDEKQLLAKCVKETNKSVGKDPWDRDAPWNVVVEKMGGTRTRTSCRQMWQGELRLTSLNGGTKGKFRRRERLLLVHRVRELWADSESELRWADLAEQYWPHLSGTVLYQVWRRMKRKLPNYESLSFQELVDALAKRYSLVRMKTGQKRKRDSPEEEEGTRRVLSSAWVDSDEEEAENGRRGR